MADEVAKDVKRGRMTGPYLTTLHLWPKKTVALATHEHTSSLIELPPDEPTPCAFAFTVIQTGSDGKVKVRRAEDWRRSGANATNKVQDTPAYHDITAFVDVIWAIKDEGEQEDIVTCALDHEDAYRQFAVRFGRPL